LYVVILKIYLYQKSVREVKQARLVNTVLGVVMKRSHALRLLLHLNTLFETIRDKEKFTRV